MKLRRQGGRLLNGSILYVSDAGGSRPGFCRACRPGAGALYSVNDTSKPKDTDAKAGPSQSTAGVSPDPSKDKPKGKSGGDRGAPRRGVISPVPRRMLGKVRQVMASAATAQERLDQIVRIIALEMVAEVCSIYLRRAGDVLELFATQGLRKDAVHKTRLRIGEGLVGEIAAHALPFALEDAQTHPSFAYRPETGEELFHSLMGVPILRGGRVLGVVAVQNRTSRSYTDEEVEVMETIAMVIAELIASGEVIRRGEQAPADGLAVAPLRLDAVKLNGGLAMGRAVLHRPYVPVGRLVAEDETQEQQRLADALAACRATPAGEARVSELLGRFEHGPELLELPKRLEDCRVEKVQSRIFADR